MSFWRTFWYGEELEKNKFKTCPLKALPPTYIDKYPSVSEENLWRIQCGNVFIRNIPKELAEEICERWNYFEGE